MFPNNLYKLLDFSVLHNLWIRAFLTTYFKALALYSFILQNLWNKIILPHCVTAMVGKVWKIKIMLLKWKWLIILVTVMFISIYE